MTGLQPVVGTGKSSAQVSLALFVCVNCARAGEAPTSASRRRAEAPDFGWPWPVRRVLVPCTGRIQPEHVLKAFESGAGLVCAVACAEDNCHYLEGSKRCARRVDYLRSVLDEVGLGGERLLLFHLPGSAAEDLALAAGRGAAAEIAGDLGAQVDRIRDEVARAVESLPPNPLHNGGAPGDGWQSYEELDHSDDDNP